MIVEENFNLKAYNSYALDVVFRFVYFPQDIEDIKLLFERGLLRRDRVLGRGNNIIFSDAYYDESLVVFHDNFSRFSVNKKKVFATSGMDMKTLSVLACNNNLSGLEYFYDIPGSFGGAIFMNAGSNDCNINSFVKELNVIDMNSGEIISLEATDYVYSYRYTDLEEKNYLILSGVVELTFGDTKNIYAEMLKINALRHLKQPRDYPNAGSVFKRPVGRYVGPMIESLGLKGFSIGGAQVSEKHAGFIINTGTATGSDILLLISHIQNEVQYHYNIELELEQVVI